MPGALITMLKPLRTISSTRQHLLASRARDMRRFALEPECALWRALRGSRLGIPFRRQVVLGNHYIADFVAPSVRLIVEVDGGVHALKGAADARRDRDLGRLGYTVLRVPAAVVINDIPAASALVQAAVEQLRR